MIQSEDQNCNFVCKKSNIMLLEALYQFYTSVNSMTSVDLYLIYTDESRIRIKPVIDTGQFNLLSSLLR